MSPDHLFENVMKSSFFHVKVFYFFPIDKLLLDRLFFPEQRIQDHIDGITTWIVKFLIHSCWIKTPFEIIHKHFLLLPHTLDPFGRLVFMLEIRRKTEEHHVTCGSKSQTMTGGLWMNADKSEIRI